MYEYNHKITINPNVLYEAVQNYIYAEEDYRTSSKRLHDMKLTSEWWNKPESSRAKEMEALWGKSRISSEAWQGLRMVCQLVSLDPSAVVAVFKSIRRNCQYQNGWNREAHFSANRYFEFEDKRPGSVESLVDLCRA